MESAEPIVGCTLMRTLMLNLRRPPRELNLLMRLWRPALAEVATWEMPALIFRRLTAASPLEAEMQSRRRLLLMGADSERVSFIPGATSWCSRSPHLVAFARCISAAPQFPRFSNETPASSCYGVRWEAPPTCHTGLMQAHSACHTRKDAAGSVSLV